jgi:hypothetical protein
MLLEPESSSGFTPRIFSDEEIAEFFREDELTDEAAAIVRRIERAIDDDASTCGHEGTTSIS